MQAGVVPLPGEQGDGGATPGRAAISCAAVGRRKSPPEVLIPLGITSHVCARGQGRWRRGGDRCVGRAPPAMPPPVRPFRGPPGGGRHAARAWRTYGELGGRGRATGIRCAPRHSAWGLGLLEHLRGQNIGGQRRIRAHLLHLAGRRPPPRNQALMARSPCPVATLIRRGFAFSATGMVSRSTPSW